MTELFLNILNMSLTGAFVIAVVCLLRIPLKKAPKFISYCLWAVVGFRLVFPFSVESVFSLMPFLARPIPADIGYQAVPQINSGVPVINNAVNALLPGADPAGAATGGNPLQSVISVVSIVWLVGMILLALYGLVTYVLQRRRMRSARWLTANVYQSALVATPFVLGILRPKIYLPLQIAANEYEYVLRHEQIHIQRHDNIIKFLAWFVLCLHWFNPLAWLAFLLLGVDMEMSCDERVIQEIGGQIRREYSQSLLALAQRSWQLTASPLAFSEGGLKQRIQNVLNYRKPARLVIIALVVLVAILSVGFVVNRVTTPQAEAAADARPSTAPPISIQTGDQSISPVISSASGPAPASPDYPTNDRGQTYGTFDPVGGRYGSNNPELVAVTASNGQSGYCYYQDWLAQNGLAVPRPAALELMGGNQQRTVDTFCQSAWQNTGSVIDAAALNVIITEINNTSGVNCPWIDLTPEQQSALMDLFPEAYRTVEWAGKSYAIACAATFTRMPVYAVDGQTVIGEMVAQ